MNRANVPLEEEIDLEGEDALRGEIGSRGAIGVLRRETGFQEIS